MAIYLDRISAFTKSVLGFDAATAVSTVLPISSSPSSVMNRIEPIAEYVNSNIMTPRNRITDNKLKKVNLILKMKAEYHPILLNLL